MILVLNQSKSKSTVRLGGVTETDKPLSRDDPGLRLDQLAELGTDLLFPSLYQTSGA